MNKYYIKEINGDVFYKKGYFDYEISKININNNNIIYFKNYDNYINYIINYIKDNIIKKYENLNLINIELNIFDNNNIVHRLIFRISNLIREFLHYKDRICIDNIVFIIIK
jgi:hypothetical protein